MVDGIPVFKISNYILGFLIVLIILPQISAAAWEEITNIESTYAILSITFVGIIVGFFINMIYIISHNRVINLLDEFAIKLSKRYSESVIFFKEEKISFINMSSNRRVEARADLANEIIQIETEISQISTLGLDIGEKYQALAEQRSRTDDLNERMSEVNFKALGKEIIKQLPDIITRLDLMISRIGNTFSINKIKHPPGAA